MKAHILTSTTISTHLSFSTLLIIQIGPMGSGMNRTWEALTASTMTLPVILVETLVQAGMIKILPVAVPMMMEISKQPSSVASAKKMSQLALKTATMTIVSLTKLEILVPVGMMKTQKDAVDGIQKHSKLLKHAVLVEEETKVIQAQTLTLSIKTALMIYQLRIQMETTVNPGTMTIHQHVETTIRMISNLPRHVACVEVETKPNQRKNKLNKKNRHNKRNNQLVNA